MRAVARRRARGVTSEAAQKRLYATRGYLVIPDFLKRAELTRLRAALASILQSGRGVTRSNGKFLVMKGPDKAYHVTRIRNPIAQHKRFYELVFHPRILDVVENLIGPNIQLQQSRLILKPRTPGTWFDWHQDFPAYPHTNFDLLIVTVYLDDSTPDNGCLTVIPGSHRLGPLPHRFTFEGAPRTQLVDPRVAADRSRWLKTPVPAGGIQVHHANLLHSSEANLTDRPRSALQLWYRAADNVQVGGWTDIPGLGLQVRGINPGIVRMDAGTCRLPGGVRLPPSPPVRPGRVKRLR
jgi:ectoine hydroxylase-related dioxygenase (phytanoyl-CoA dioxygenase family)